MTYIPLVKFYSGLEIPILGLGTWQSKSSEATQAVKDAIDIGYRHIDCAYLYQNEKEVGIGINDKIAEGVVKRKDLFVTSKLWSTCFRPEVVESAIKRSLTDLRLDYLDLYLIHCPLGLKEGDELYPVGPNGLEYSDVDYVDTWKAMETVCKKGFAKSIGVSNFNEQQLKRILQVAEIMPVTNQIENHPYLNEKKLSDFCKSKGITITAYSPLGSPDRPRARANEPNLLDDITIKEIATRLNKTCAQVLLRYQVQQGNIVIPKSVKKSRILENSQIFDFELSLNDVKLLESLECKRRIFEFKEASTHPYYPW